MTANEFITQLLSINDKFYKVLDAELCTGYFEVLHASLMILKDSTGKKVLDEMPMATKMAIEKLEKKIYSKTSADYKDKHAKDLNIQQENEINQQDHEVE